MIKDNVKAAKERTKDAVIVAATKYVGVEEMKELLAAGISNMGENRVQSFFEKYEILKEEPIIWHFIGHLQTNKVKKMINQIDYLHSLDRLSLAEAIQKERNQRLDCFVEVNISSEFSKTGLPIKDVLNFIKNLEKYDKIHIVGLMGMAENTIDEDKIYQQFISLYHLKEQIVQMKLDYAPCMFLSMGMSSDFPIALKAHATHLRLGSILFRKEEI